MAIVQATPVEGKELSKVQAIGYLDNTPLDETWLQVERNTIPEYPQEEGFVFEMYINPKTKVFSFEKKAAPKVDEKDAEIARLRQQLAEAQAQA